MDTRILLQAHLCCNGVEMGHPPSYLNGLYGKLQAEAGEDKLVVMSGWSGYDHTDVQAIAPAKMAAALEEHVIAQIPKGAGSVEIKLYKRGRVERQYQLVHTAEGQLQLQTLPFVCK